MLVWLLQALGGQRMSPNGRLDEMSPIPGWHLDQPPALELLSWSGPEMPHPDLWARLMPLRPAHRLFSGHLSGDLGLTRAMW